MTVQQLGGAINSFQLIGYPVSSCRPTGAEKAIGCMSISLADGARVTGTGVTMSPISSATKFRVYTSTDYFTSSIGQTLSLGSGTSPVSAHPPTSATNSTSPVGVGLLIGFGAGVLVVAGLGFFLFSWARRKRRPFERAEQVAVLAASESALKYWDTAIDHLGEVDENSKFELRNRHQVDVDPARTVLHATGNEMASRHETWIDTNDAEFEKMILRAHEGRDAAVKYRDRCQMELIRCMASGGSTLVPMLFEHGFDSVPLTSGPSSARTPVKGLRSAELERPTRRIFYEPRDARDSSVATFSKSKRLVKMCTTVLNLRAVVLALRPRTPTPHRSRPQMGGLSNVLARPCTTTHYVVVMIP